MGASGSLYSRSPGGGEPLVHLDLKPEHIFLERIRDHWHVKVIDFGIAEIVSVQDSDGDATDSERPVRRVAGTLRLFIFFLIFKFW